MKTNRNPNPPDRSFRHGATFAACAVLLVCLALDARAAEPEGGLDRVFSGTVRPFLETHCFACHGREKQKGKLDISHYAAVETVAQDLRRWEDVLDRLQGEEMPPEEAKSQPSPELRREVIGWIRALRAREARRHAGDPGPVLARRLSNAEYNYTIRDLTGVDIRPAQEFPVDPANEAGFDNSGESLAMSPSLLNKYLEASRRVAEHIALTPSGLVFAPHPVVTETDRDRYCVKRIIDFYKSQPTDLADYFRAAWRFRNRAAMGQPNATLAECAAADRVSPKYLDLVWSTLAKSEVPGPLATLRRMWSELPAPVRANGDAARSGCEKMRDFVVGLREKLRPEVANLSVRGIAAGSQPLVLWKDREYAANRRKAATKGSTDPELAPPADPAARARHESALAEFCGVFPDAFAVSERGLVFLKEDKDSHGRLLSAGFHLMTGYFRDDQPLYDLILDERGQWELDNLWDEFHFITGDAVRQYKDFIFFERAEPPRFMQGAEFDFARSEDKDATTAAKIGQLAEAYLAKARRNGGEGQAIVAIEDFFKTASADIRRTEHERLAAEPNHLRALQAWAEKAYRRPLSQAERDDLLAFYRGLREKDGLGHDEAIRDTVASVLMSPHFCYRLDIGNTSRPASGAIPAAVKTRALSDHSLASRLSYFLWSSMPDDELIALARAGKLRDPATLLAQTRRMLRDDRVRGLATEFGGNWLDFRRFEEHNSVDRERFKSFDNELRQAMFEEPIRFFLDVVRADRSVLDFLDGRHTFVNPVLARHYGVPEPRGGSNAWVRIEDAERYGRGGLLPMSVFLTKNAPGLRTSPVKRGYWVARNVLGERIPPPPPKVPELPSDEAKLGGLTVREALAKHREDKSCAGCHARFDGLGLVFEGFGPVGERRERDLGGRPVDTRATFPGGGEGAGIEGLRLYLRERRQPEFLDNLCRKLLAYALGRSLLPSDDSLVDDMRAKLAANGHRFDCLVETIVSSPQFLNRRDFETAASP